MSQVAVSYKIDNGMKHEIKAGSHSFISDANKENGGAESGPNPHELMLAALGSCTSMTLKIFSEKRGWKLEAVNVHLKEESIEDPEKPGKKISKITREIEIKGDLDKEQLDTLKSIADKCPIHKLLVEPKQILTELSPTK